jgi:hypothetical protein
VRLHCYGLPNSQELAEAVRRSLSEGQRDNRLANEIYKSLRQIYFMPDGVLSLLKDIQWGNKISKSRLETALPAFNDKQWKIEKALKNLDWSRLNQEIAISLHTAQALQLIRDGKVSLRQDIQDTINSYGQPWYKPSTKAKVTQLIRTIQKLNSKIDEIDRTLRFETR